MDKRHALDLISAVIGGLTFGFWQKDAFAGMFMFVFISTMQEGNR